MNKLLDGLIVCCVLIAIGLLYYFIKKYREYSRQSKLYNLVSWCVTDDSKIYRNNLRLEDYIWNAQIKLNPAPELKINKDDYELTRVILKQYQQDTTVDYFNKSENFNIPKSKQKIDGETYFLWSLYSYLRDFQTKYEFKEHKIYNNLIQEKDIGQNIYHSTYELTDFGLVMYKLLYICLVSIINDPKLNKTYIPTVQIDNLKKSISSRTISI